MSALPFAVTTPVSVSKVGLKARDADALARYYQDVIGLAELSRTNGHIVLGAGQRPLLEIEEDRSAEPDNPRSAGLFHTAFLMPSREDLARWVRHTIEKRTPIAGASDHLVSEALYLNDPEGNGIEIYADRPREQWPMKGSEVKMATIPLDIEALLGTISEEDNWKGAPDGSVVGHVHLRVGDPKKAEDWWNSEMGFDTMARYGDAAVFLSSGGYHHHIGANSWRSAGAGRRDPRRTGLAWVELQDQTATGDKMFEDPWGTGIKVSPAAR